MTTSPSLRHVARGSVAYGAGRVVTIGIQTAVFACLARALTPDLFGALAAGFATVAVIDAIAEFGLTPTALVRMGADADGAERHAAATTKASALTLCVAAAMLAPVLFVYSGPARLATLCLLPSVLIQRLATGQVVLRRHRLDLRRLNVAELAGRCTGGALILASLLVDVPDRTRIVLVGAATAVGALVTALCVLDTATLRAGSEPGAHRRLLVTSIPLGIAAGISLVHARADQILLELFGRQEELATYSLGYRTVESVIGVLALGSGAAFALIAGLSGERRTATASVAFRGVSLVGFAGSAALLLASVPVGRILGGTGLPLTADYIRLLAPIVWISAMNALVAQLCILAGRQRWLLSVAAAATVVNLVSGVITIPLGGAPALALVSVVTEAGAVLATIHVASRRLHIVEVGSMVPEGVACLGLVASSLLWNAGVPWPVAALVAAASTALVVASRRHDARRLVLAVLSRRSKAPAA